MYDRKVVRRRRAALAVFVALSIAILTAYFGESGSGFFHALQRGAQEAFAPIEASVISVTSAVPPVTFVTLPTRPPVCPCSGSLPAAITGWFTRMPSLDPLSILMLEYQTVVERAITRAVTGSVALGK